MAIPDSSINKPVTTFSTQTQQTKHPRLILTSVLLGAIMAFLDATMVNIALVNIQRQQHTTLLMVSWVLNAYNLTFAILLIPVGWLADQFGRKRLFLVGIVLFGVGSLVCAFSPSIAWLIVARAVQGCGGAILSAVGLAIIPTVFPPGEWRNTAMGIWGAANGLAIAIGPVIGGALVQFLDWEWIFLINIPLCLVSLIMVFLYVPETKDEKASKKIDTPGLLVISGTILCLVLAILQGNTWGWMSPGVLFLFAVALAGLVSFPLVEQKQAYPMVDVRLFRLRSFTEASVETLLFAVALMGAFVIFVLYLRDLGNNPLVAALFLLPTPLTSFVVSLLASKIGRWASPRVAVSIGLGLLIIGLFCLSTLDSQLTLLDVSWRGAILGIGMGLCFSNLPSFALSEVSPAQAGVASGIFSTALQLGFTLGVATLISVLASQHLSSLQHAFAVTWIVAALFAGGGLIVAALFSFKRFLVLSKT